MFPMAYGHVPRKDVFADLAPLFGLHGDDRGGAGTRNLEQGAVGSPLSSVGELARLLGKLSAVPLCTTQWVTAAASNADAIS